MRVNRRKVKRRDEQILVSNCNEHSSIDRRVTLVRRDIRLQGLSGVGARDLQRRVSDIQLRRPEHPLRLTSLRGCRVAVVRADGFTGGFPGEVDFTAGPGERSSAVAGDSGGAGLADFLVLGARLGVRGENLLAQGVHTRRDGRVAGVFVTTVDERWVGLVEDRQCREVLPRQTGLVLRARGDVWCDERPGPRLRDANLKPHGHGEESLELPEDHLLACLRGNRLCEQGRCLARVQVSQESVDARLSEPRELLAEVQEFVDGSVGVVVDAFLRGRGAQDVGQHRGVANFLVRHVFNQVAVFGRQAGVLEILDREPGQTIVKEVQLDVLLVRGEGLLTFISIYCNILRVL